MPTFELGNCFNDRVRMGIYSKNNVFYVLETIDSYGFETAWVVRCKACEIDNISSIENNESPFVICHTFPIFFWSGYKIHLFSISSKENFFHKYLCFKFQSQVIKLINIFSIASNSSEILLSIYILQYILSIKNAKTLIKLFCLSYSQPLFYLSIF